MKNYYNSIQTVVFRGFKKNSNKSFCFDQKSTSFVKSFMVVVFFLFGIIGIQAQTTLIDPAQEGGFNVGNTFASNGWSVSNGPNNPWVVSNGVTTAPIAGNAAYISDTGGSTHTYDKTKNAENFFWRDVTVPAGETRIKLTFDWLTTGASTDDAFYVFAVPTSVTPTGSSNYPGTGNGPTPTLPGSYSVFIGGHTATTVQSQTIFFPASYAGTTFRLVFYWKNNNNTTGTQPPGLVDNISLKSQVPMTFTSVTSGNTTSPATWGETVEYPGTVDNIVISTGHTVSVNGNSTEYVGSVTVNGTLNFLYLASPGITVSSYYIGGNVTVNSGGLFNGFHLNGTTASWKTIYVGGNIINNGRFDLSGGGIMNLNGSTVQSVSGTGVFGGTVTSTTSTNRVGLISTLYITNTNAAIPNINWQVNNLRLGTIQISGTIPTLTFSKVNLNGNKIIIGNYAGGSLTAEVGSGFMNGTVARWWTTGQTGSAINTTVIPFAEPTTGTSRYPFVSATGLDRSMYITRSSSSTTGNTAGELSVVYSDATTTTTGLSVADGAYTINNRFDGNWTITKDASYVYVTGTHAVTVVAPGSLFPSVPKTRLMLAAAPIAGTHVDGNVKPVALKTTMTTADITSGAIYLGIASADQANTSIASGNWDATTTWSKGTAPVCGEAVTIAPGHAVVANSFGPVSGNLTISAGATLTVSGGDLTVGCTANNTTFTNNGTLTVSDGTIYANGNFFHSQGSTFNQSGGEIIVDGNDNGNAATSFRSSFRNSIVQFVNNTLNLTGGVLTVLDPDATTATSPSSYSIDYYNTIINQSIGLGHTLKFGNGLSSDAGSNSNYGFGIGKSGSRNLSLGNVEINSGLGINRFVTLADRYNVAGNLTITSGELRPGNELFVSGNFINNGVYRGDDTSILTMGSFVNNTVSTATSAQTISGTGTFLNSNAPTATAVVASGVVTGITLSATNTGSGYATPPTVTMIGAGVGALATAVLTDGVVTAVNVTNGGTGYTTAPKVIFSGGSYLTTPASAASKIQKFNVNNTSATGVTLSMPLAVTGTLTLTSGKVNTAGANVLTLGDATTAGTLTGGSATAYVNGPFERYFANANTSFQYYPVGTSTGLKAIWLNPTTTALGASSKVTAFNSNSGTAASILTGLSTTTRWEAPITNGSTAISNMKVKISDAGLIADNLVVQAPTAAGEYAADFGVLTINYDNSTAIPTLESQNGIAPSAYTGFLSYASLTPCSGTPTPGNTLATSNSLCFGQSTTLSIQNIPSTTGNTYQWQSSTNGTTFVNVSGADSYSLTVTPTVPTYYSCKITCANGSAFANSTALQVIFANQIATTTPASFCSPGTAVLGATANTGATVKWYDAATGGLPLATGASFTTPSLSATTTYYAESTTSSAGLAANGNASTVLAVSAFSGNVSDSGVSPFANFYKNVRTQYLFKASELIASGIAAGNITSIAFDVTNVTGLAPIEGYTVKMANTTDTTMAAAFATTGTSTTVYGPVTQPTPTVGINTITFSSPFTWDGVSNVVIELCNASTNYTVDANIKYTTTSFNSVFSRYSDTVAMCNATTSGTAMAVANQTKRPNIIFGAQVACASPRVAVVATATTTPSDAPTAVAQTFCGSGTVANLVATGTAIKWYAAATGGTALATTEALTSTSYYASQTVAGLCESARTEVAVTVNVTPAPTASAQSFCGSGTVTDLVATGTAIKWYAAATGGTALATTTALSTTDYYASQTLNGCEGPRVSVSVTVNETAAPSASAQTFCGSGTVADLVATGTAIKWYAAATGGTALATTEALSTTNYFASQTLNGCEGPRTSVAVTVNVTPAPTAVAQTFCGSGTVADLVATGTAIKWYAAATGGTALATTEALSSTNYFASQTLNGCEGPRTSVAVTVNVTPAPTASAQSFCGSGTVADLVATGTAIKWYAAATGGTALATTEALSSTNYFASQTLNGCEGPRVSVAVTVNVTAAPTAVAQTFCGSGTVADLVATGTDIKWYAAATGGTALATTAALSTTNYFVSQTLNGCEGPRTSVAVTVNVTAAPTASAQSFCGSGTVADLVATGTAIKWYAAATGGTALATTAALSTTNYFASQTLNGCEGPRTSVAVTVNVTAAPTAVAQTFCGSGTVADLVATGTAIKWYAASTGGTALATTTALSSTNYFASQTLNGCEGPRVSVAVTVNVTAAPTAVAQTFCGSGTVADLVATGTAIKWYAASTGGTALATTAALSTTNYFASQTLNGCEGPRVSVAVTVNVTAAPTASAQSFCGSGTVANLVATGTAIKWYAAATGGTALATTAALSTTNYFASQTLNGCEGPRTSVAVTVNVIAAPTGSATQDSCTGTIAAFVVNGATGATFNWYASNTATTTIPTSTTAVLNTIYYVSQTVNGCEGPRFAVTASGPCLGKEVFDVANFDYYPNPTNSLLNISYSAEITQIRVFNMLGQEVLSQKLNATTTQVNLSQFASGTYFVQVTADKVSKTVKVVKE
jgi:hypothetical protein